MVEIDVSNQNYVTPLQVEEQQKRTIVIPDNLPVLPLRNLVLFPYTVTSVSVGQARSLRLLENVISDEKLVAVVAYKDPKVEQPDPEHLYKVGCVAQILRARPSHNGNFNVLLQGLNKIEIDEWTAETPYLRADLTITNDIEPDKENIEAEAVRGNLLQLFSQLVSMLSFLSDDLLRSVIETKDYRHLLYLISSSMRLDVANAQLILEQDDVLAKMHKLAELLDHEIKVLELGKKIQQGARGEMEKAQREYVLRQQIKAIQRELGEEDGNQIKAEEYRKKIETLGMPDEAFKQAEIELSRLERIPEASSEHGQVLNYLDWLTELPWDKYTQDSLDINQAKKILDEDHYGLDKIKRRILEYLAVRQLRQQRQTTSPDDVVLENVNEKENQTGALRAVREGAILCFVGPPGIGKTSLGHSIARALGRKLQRISLGGIRDEAEIRGHRRTYVGAMPGRFIKALREVGSKNPVILLDEVDKVGADWHGDPSSALLEVLDPEQNRQFRDHYLEVAFDLSQMMFIATANLLDTIPAPLRDRMEVISLPGYTDNEKLNIAQRYLLPRQKKENCLKETEISITDGAMLKLIREYTREAGVRSLDRRIGALCRKAVVQIAGGESKLLKVDVKTLEELMGKPMFFYDVAERTALPGVATGLAVTSVGGDILFVEVSGMPGKKGLTITGQLGDVMRESVEAALSYVRTKAKELGVKEDFYETTDIHVHIPAGATPKDGPSAGVTLVTALVSWLSNRPVHHDLAMTGEITLRGQVLPVGGIKDKILAADRAGLKRVILPKRNEKDLDDLPKSIHKRMKFVLAEQVDTVLENALAANIEQVE